MFTRVREEFIPAFFELLICSVTLLNYIVRRSCYCVHPLKSPFSLEAQTGLMVNATAAETSRQIPAHLLILTDEVQYKPNGRLMRSIFSLCLSFSHIWKISLPALVPATPARSPLPLASLLFLFAFLPVLTCD